MSTSRRVTLLRSVGLAAITPIAAVFLAIAVPALASWSVSGTGGAGGAATTMPVGNSPAVAVTGSDVAVRWPASTFPNGAAVEGYIVQRFDAATGQQATVGGTCAGAVTSTTCTDTSVPAGTWVYTVIPIQGGWTGGASSPSPAVTVS